MTIVEPQLAVAKDENDADDRVDPGQTVHYTITGTNPNGASGSTAHDVTMVDTRPGRA